MSKASHKRQRKGFSLLELLAVVTILGIIALVVKYASQDRMECDL